jgi:hypothetical protein
VRNAIIMHGRPGREEYYDPAEPSASNAHWLPWLAKQLLIRDIPAHTPEVPWAYDPKWDIWRREFERFDVTAQTLLVGHSFGAGFLVRWLSQNPAVRVSRVVLVAPFIDPDGDRAPEFFDFTIDANLAARTDQLVVFNSDNDGEHIQRSARIIVEQIPGATYREFSGYGHFTYESLGGQVFTELLSQLCD